MQPDHRTHHFSDGSTKVARRLVVHRHTIDGAKAAIARATGGEG